MKVKPLVNLKVKDLIKYCSLNNKKEEFIINDFRQTNRENIHEVFKYQKFNDDFTDFITLNNNGKFTPCYDEFLAKLGKNLGIKRNRYDHYDNEELTNELMERLKLLRTLPDNEIYNQFDNIDKDYKEGKKYYKEIEKLKQDPLYKEVYETEKKYYYSCGLKNDLYHFITYQIEIYKRMITDRDKYKELIKKTHYNDYLKKHFDMDKVNLFVVNKYLNFCEQTDDRKVILKYFKEIEKYLKSNPNRNKFIYIGNKEINFDTIVTRVMAIQRKLDRIDGNVEWILAPDGRSKHAKKIGEPRTIGMTLERLEKLSQAGEDKREFYRTSPYAIKLYGMNRYKGYVAYVYENGSIVLDKLYNSNYPSTAMGNAVYIIPASLFEMVSGVDKQGLRKIAAVKKINHTDTWKERLQLELDKEREDKEKTMATELIKKYKK